MAQRMDLGENAIDRRIMQEILAPSLIDYDMGVNPTVRASDSVFQPVTAEFTAPDKNPYPNTMSNSNNNLYRSKYNDSDMRASTIVEQMEDESQTNIAPLLNSKDIV